MAYNISFTTTFDRTTNTMTFVDTTNYASQGVLFGVNASLKGYLKITYNTGAGSTLVYNAWPIPPNPPWPATDSSDVGGNAVFTAAVNIPLTSAGLPLPAEYTIEYKTYVFIGLATIVSTKTNTYTYSLQDPVVCIDTAVNCLNSALESNDATNYSVPNATVVSITRDHTLYPPPASGLAQMGPLNSSTLIYSGIYTTTWTAEVISTVTYLQPDGLIIIAVVSGVKEFQVNCDTNLSKIICCLVNLQNEYEALECKNPVKAQIFKSTKLDPSLQHLALFLAAQSAGNQSKMAAEYQELLDASGCGGDCGCGDTTPQIVAPSNVTMSYAVNSPLGTIDVTTVIAGNVTTFNIDVDPAILSGVLNATTTVVSTTTPSYLTITQVGAAPNLDFQIDFNQSAIGNLCEKLIIIDPALNLTLDYLEFTNTSLANYGTKIAAVGSQSVVLGLDIASNPIVPNTAASYAAFIFNGILVTGTDPCTVTAEVMSTWPAPLVNSISNIAAEVYHINTTTGDVYVRLINPQNGSVYQLQDLNSGTWDKIYIKFNLIA